MSGYNESLTPTNLTNFARLHDHQKKVWSRDLWKRARDQSFLTQFMGKGHTAMITSVTELTESERGTKAVFHLVADIEGDGVTSDNMLEDHEDEIKSYDQAIQIDYLRNAVRNVGKFNDQKTVINFREQAKDQLSYWLSDRMDQMGFLTLSGVGYEFTNKGALRPTSNQGKTDGYKLADLEFAADVTAPSAGRHLIVNASGELEYAVKSTEAGKEATVTTNITADSKLTYKSLVQLHAYMKDNYIRGVGAAQDLYHIFLTPQGLAQLKLDPDFMSNVRHAGRRGDANPLFRGTETLYVDGLLIHEYRHVYNNVNAADGSKFGASGDINGQRILVCGAQALAMASIGSGSWNEKTFDYSNSAGISMGKIFGMLKPRWKCKATGLTEDFGVVCVDTALPSVSGLAPTPALRTATSRAKK